MTIGKNIRKKKVLSWHSHFNNYKCDSRLFSIQTLTKMVKIYFQIYNCIGGQGGGAVHRPPPLFAKYGMKIHPRGSIIQNFLEHNNI